MSACADISLLVLLHVCFRIEARLFPAISSRPQHMYWAREMIIKAHHPQAGRQTAKCYRPNISNVSAMALFFVFWWLLMCGCFCPLFSLLISLLVVRRWSEMADVWGDAIKIQHSGLEMVCDDNVKQQRFLELCITITLKCSNHHPFTKLWIGPLLTGVRIMGIFADSLLITAHCVCRLLEIYLNPVDTPQTAPTHSAELARCFWVAWGFSLIQMHFSSTSPFWCGVCEVYLATVDRNRHINLLLPAQDATFISNPPS